MKQSTTERIAFFAWLATIASMIIIMAVSCRAPQQIADRKCDKAQAKYERSAYRWGCPLVQRVDTIRDLQIIRERHDTTIYFYIAGDTVREVDTVYIINGIAQSPEHRIDTQYAYSVSFVKDSKLYHILVQKEAVIAQTIKDAIQNNSRVEYKTVIKTITEKTNYLTQWQIAQMWLGRLMIALVILFVGFIALKMFLKIK